MPLAFLTAFESLDPDSERAAFDRSPLRRRSCRNRMQPPGSQPARSPLPATQQSIIECVHGGLSCVQAIAAHSIQDFASGDFWTHPPTVSDHRTSKGGRTRVTPMLSTTNTPPSRPRDRDHMWVAIRPRYSSKSRPCSSWCTRAHRSSPSARSRWSVPSCRDAVFEGAVYRRVLRLHQSRERGAERQTEAENDRDPPRGGQNRRGP
jgi:hypothetical protein